MTFKHAALAIVTAGMLTAAGAAIAQRPDHGHGGAMEFLHGLNLTDAQKTQVHQIMQSNWAAAKPLMQQEHALHEQIITQLLTAGTTEEQIQPLVQQEEALRTQMDAARLSMALKVRAVLTPEQLAQASSQHEKLEALHQQEREVTGGGDEAH